MKKLLLFISILSFIFTACKKHPGDLKITILGPSDVYIGGRAKITIIIKPDIVNNGKIEKLTVKGNDGNAILDTTLNSEQTTTVPVSIDIPQDIAEGSTYTITVEATEANTGHTTTETKICNVKESNARVNIEAYTYNNTVQPGDDVYIDIYLSISNDDNVPAELGTLTIKDNSGVVSTQDLFGEYATIYYTYTVPDDAQIGETIPLIFEATEKYSGKVSSDTLILSVNYNLYSDNTHLYFDSTSLYRSMMLYFDSDYIYTTNGTDSYGDIAFVWDNTYGYSLVSPDAPWITSVFADGIQYDTTNKKTTLLAPYSGSTSWDNIDASTIYNYTINSSTVSGGGIGVQDLEEGDILMFKTQNNIKGAIYISYLGEEYGNKALSFDAKFINLPQ